MSIEILPQRLANQIAAGEVVERPASVVKELVENSLDAGATRIQIDVERGGHKLIRIRDNGKGIDKNELGLALSRHATSKVKTLDDLEQIASLGFRGEALASISSVSRLTLSSKPAHQEDAWQAYAEGRDMEVQIRPTAHPDGTTIEVADLFFNTPARRKFLRTEKTEFHHIDELLKRIALSRFDVAITLKHNNKVVRQYRPQTDSAQFVKRVAQVAGHAFNDQALYIESGDDELKLYGWVLPVGVAKEPQYTYVNGRMMRDKLILHAIRQAFEEVMPGCDIPSFVLYLDINPRQVDVNVHPAKHEVRFHQGRLVHDFIIQAVKQVVTTESTLEQCSEVKEQASHYQAPFVLAETDNFAPQPSAESTFRSQTNHGAVSYPKSREFQGASTQAQQQSVNAFYQGVSEQSAQHFDSSINTHFEPSVSQTLVSVANLMPLRNGYCILAQAHNAAMASMLSLLAPYWQQQITDNGELANKALLLPVRINLSEDLVAKLQQNESWLSILGLDLQLNRNFVLVKKVPLDLYSIDITTLIDQVLGMLQTPPETIESWLTWLQTLLLPELVSATLTESLAKFIASNPQYIERLQAKAVKIDVAPYINQLEQGCE